MSFFNLTELGADNIVRASVTDQSLESRNNSASKEGTPVSSKFDETVLPNSLANGSHKKYTALLQKHQRSPIGPNEIYVKPVTTNMKYGWWMKDGVGRESWTKTERHSCVHSEMTRFVDEMSLTNREFSLF
ncbi:testis-expressed protein 49-like [Xenia sp. Carnegie-2017]|uniref:testis-expressed protein 49-like n=1 Tax=Xenia sp. Carnegie-2017 TaxID=2897299 RepID=UPI001F03A683|nr:testis-expressed protein 49-like [Xenia sp. Carnegie-2017]